MGVMTHPCILSTCEIEVGRLWVQGQPELHISVRPAYCSLVSKDQKGIVFQWSLEYICAQMYMCVYIYLVDIRYLSQSHSILVFKTRSLVEPGFCWLNKARLTDQWAPGIRTQVLMLTGPALSPLTVSPVPSGIRHPQIFNLVHTLTECFRRLVS